MADSLAAIVSAETSIGRPSPTTRRLVNASVSDNTRRAVGADSAPFTRLDPTMPPTSFDIGLSLNPCPRKLGAPQPFAIHANRLLILDDFNPLTHVCCVT